MLKDFGHIKEEWGGWLNDALDHGTMLQEGDPIVDLLLEHSIPTKLFVVSFPPSAENIAKFLFDTFKPIDSRLCGVEVFETPNCSALYQGS